MNYEFGLRGHDIADNFSDMCKKASEYNIKKLQFAMAKTISDTDFDKLGYDEQMAQKVAEGLREENLKVSVLGCYINPVDPDEKARNVSLLRFKNFLRYAKKFNALGVGTETGSAGDMKKTYSDENYKQFVNDFMSIADVAESLDVNILIEPVWGLTIHSVEKMKQMIDDVKSDKLNVILDVSNITVLENYGEQDRMIMSAFESFGDRIKVIHFKDFCI